MLNYAKLCGKSKIVRKYAENWKLCDSALTALKSCLWKWEDEEEEEEEEEGDEEEEDDGEVKEGDTA